MAWRSSGSSNAELIRNMAAGGIFQHKRVEKAMLAVDRANYVRNKLEAYEDSPQLIGHGATISAPHMHAYAAEHLQSYLKPGARVLDIGSGSGYVTALLHHLVSEEQAQGKVVGIEHIAELGAWSTENLRKDGLGHALDSQAIEIIVGDGRLGYPSAAPYDVIHVGAAAPILPSALVDQLATPGRMFIPVGTHTQYIMHVDKDAEGNVTETEVMGVRYVPLTDRDKQTSI